MCKVTNTLIFSMLTIILLITTNDLAAGQALTDLSHPIAVSAAAPQVSIRLPTNPSTGYQWVLVQYDHALLQPAVSKYYPPSGNQIGAPGVSVWQFHFKKIAFAVSQQTVVVLQYKRPWEHTVGREQKIYFNINTGDDDALQK